MKNKAIAVALTLLTTGLASAVQAAPLLIGSWQNNTGDGWTDSSDVSITNAANMPAKYEFETGVVAGYAQSLGIHETGFGNVRLKINLTTLGGAVAAFTNGTKMQFTFSCPPDTGAGAGYMQLVQFQYNSPGSGFQNISSNWSSSFSATGSTNNNSGSGQPIFYFSPSSPARSQVVTWDYSSVKSNILNAGITYLQFTFVFQTGGGAPTNVLMNNIQLLGSSAVPDGTIIVDDFVPAGVSPANPANYDRYQSTNVYSGGQITNVYGNWFGSAFSSLSWDSTTDANNSPSSGSLKIDLNWANGSQFVVWNQGSVNNFFALNINALQYTNFQCDVKFAPGSASDAGNFGQPIFGHLRFGDRTSSYGQDWFGAVDIAATNTGWVHVSIPLNAIADQNLTNINGLLFNIDKNFYNLNLTGTSTFWIDNIKFVGATTVFSNPPPILAIEKARPALRIFAGSTANIYDREGLATTDNSQSWVGGTYPVSYSFKLLSYPANINQTHIFIVPVNASGQANMGNAGTPNQFIDYQASNILSMVINPLGGGSVSATVQWKTNTPNANPNQTALTITNSTAIGTWTLRFNSASTGTLTAPGASPVAFTINDANVSTDFANPAVAYFGIQPNSTAGIGQHEDWGSISVSGVAGTQESEDFTTDTTFNPNNYWAINSAQASSLQLATASSPYWINWTLPASGYGLGTAMSITGNTNTSGYPWVLPEYYNNYNDGLTLPGAATQGSKVWVLAPTNCLPTVDGTVGGPLAPDAFFKLVNPPLAN